MSTKVTAPFNRLYLPGSTDVYTKLAISAVQPGSATQISTYTNHGLYGTDLITIYNNDTLPPINFIDTNPTIIDGKRFTIPIDTTGTIQLSSNGYVIKRSSKVGPVRYKQDYNDVGVPVTVAGDRYINAEYVRGDQGIQSEVDLSLVGIPREEISTVMLEEVTRYGLDINLWRYSSNATINGGGRKEYFNGDYSGTWWEAPKYKYTLDPISGAKRLSDLYVSLSASIYDGTYVYFDPKNSRIELAASIPKLTGPDPYFLSPSFPGNILAGEAYATLETNKPFKYLPGRTNVFTYGVRAVVDNANSMSDQDYYEGGQVPSSFTPTGNVVRWGCGNETDAYYFQLSGNGAQGENSKVVFSVNRRRYFYGNAADRSSRGWTNSSGNQRGLGPLLPGYPTDAFYDLQPDPAYFDTGAGYDELTTVAQSNFLFDTVDGKGKSGAILNSDKLTMFKIEFSWYGATGARFFAYLPNQHNKAEWILLHEITGASTYNEPVLRNPVFQIKYLAKSRAGGIAKLFKYGVSAYIEGGNTGTTLQKTVASTTSKQINNLVSKPLVGISTTDIVPNSFGEKIPNKKVLFPNVCTISSSKRIIVDLVYKPTRYRFRGVTQGPILSALGMNTPTISAIILPNTNFRALSGNFTPFVKNKDPKNVIDFIGARISEAENGLPQKQDDPYNDPYRINTSILQTYVVDVSTNRTTNDTLILDQPLTGVNVDVLNYVNENIYKNYINTPLKFKFTQPDRQARSREIFVGRKAYDLMTTRDNSMLPLATNTYSLSSAHEYYIGAYFLRNYVAQLSANGNDAKKTGITTKLPHLLSAGETFQYYINGSSSDSQNVLGTGLIRSGSVQLTAGRIIDPYTFVAITSTLDTILVPGAPDNASTQYITVSTSVLGYDYVPYITLDRGIPNPIPTSNIAYTGFGTYEVPSLSGSNMYRTYGLPPTRATWTPVVYNIQSYPCSIDITALDPDTYQYGVTPLTAIAASFTPGADFYWNDGYGGANVSTYSLPVDRTTYDPFVLVFNGANLASIRDTAIIVDQGQSTQQVTNINWIPLSSIQIGPQNILNTAALSVVYPYGYSPTDLPPNPVPVGFDSGAAIDLQSSQPFYGPKNWIPYAFGDTKDPLLTYESLPISMRPRLVTTFHVGEEQTQTISLLNYFGITKEFLANININAVFQPIGSYYLVARAAKPGEVADVDITLTWEEQ
jgi:hypothetical protein